MQRRTVLGGLLFAFGCTPTGRRLADTPLPDEDDEAPVPVVDEPLIFLDRGETDAVPGHASRPLLIFVIPEDPNLRYRRGQAYGELLNHGDDASLAPLALFEVACAPMSELRQTHRNLPSKSEPWLVVIDRTVATPVATAHADPELDLLALRDGSEPEIDARIARLAGLIRDAIEPAMAARLARREQSALSPSMKDELAITTRHFTVARVSLAASAAGSLYAEIAPWGPPKDDWQMEVLVPVIHASLASVVRDQLVRGRPPKGSNWAHAAGCGVVVEGVERQHAIGCGMGSVPKRSQRFLQFLVAEAGR